MKILNVNNQTFALPIYLPDATRAVTKSLDSKDITEAGIEGVVVNTLHLADAPGLDSLTKLGGVKGFMNFKGLVTSDSGGWQVFSLIHRSKSGGKITDEGISFSLGTSRKKIFTPEESISTQLKIGSDIVVCLDDFTSPTATYDQALESVNRTTLWAKRCKAQFELESKELKTKPILMAVIQGGWHKDLRRKSANDLVELGFEAFGFGGYVVDDTGNLDLDISEYIAKLIPDSKLKFALGCGKPQELAPLRKMGWDIFDCTIPTRDARHQRLYTFLESPTPENINNKNIYSHIDIGKTSFALDQSPIEPTCNCHACKNYTKAYIHHLFKIKDTSALRLATIHNLRHYARIIETLRTMS